MIQKLFRLTLRILSGISGKRVAYFSNASRSKEVAVRSDRGFWYRGDILDTGDIAYGILNNGEVESDETKVVESILNSMLVKKDVLRFHDVGANTGWYSMVAANLSEKVLVESYEPLPYHIRLLEETVKMNDMEHRVTIHKFGLSSRAGQHEFHVAGSGSSLEKKFAEAGSETGMIETKRLDELRVSGADFIKMDIEGHELEALRGATSTIELYRPVLFVEIAHTLRNLGRDFKNEKYRETLDFLGSLGYSSHILKSGQLVPFDHNSEIPDGVHMYLFTIPELHSYLINGQA